MRVRVIEFIPPNGRREEGYIELADDPERQRKYDEIEEAGCDLTCEVLRLMYNKVSMCISCDEVEDDFIMNLTDNPNQGGPSGEEATEQVIDMWDKEKFQVWKDAH